MIGLILATGSSPGFHLSEETILLKLSRELANNGEEWRLPRINLTASSNTSSTTGGTQSNILITKIFLYKINFTIQVLFGNR